MSELPEFNGNGEQAERERAAAIELLTGYLERREPISPSVAGEIVTKASPEAIQETVVEKAQGMRERARYFTDFSRAYQLLAEEGETQTPYFEAALRLSELATSTLAMENNISIHNRHRAAS